MPEPYTVEEILGMQRHLEASLRRTEQENPGIRPLPPMTEDEAKGVLQALVDTSTVRVLTDPEAWLAGQLLAVYRMAVEARMLGRKGRYFVISEGEFERLIKRGL